MSEETEEQLVARAQQALNSCNWIIGECADQWTRKYAEGRTDADFGVLIGLSGDQVYQRRRVWESFGGGHEEFPSLRWSHFYVAINWEDASACLQWANDVNATVAEMKAWRRAQHGEDLSIPAIEEPPFSVAPEFLQAQANVVRDVEGNLRKVRHGSGAAIADEDEDAEQQPLAASAARSSNDDYAPFGKGARGSAPREEDKSKSRRSVEQVVAKACQALERVVAAMTPETLGEFPDLPIALQQRFLDAIENLQARAAGLS